MDDFKDLYEHIVVVIVDRAHGASVCMEVTGKLLEDKNPQWVSVWCKTIGGEERARHFPIYNVIEVSHTQYTCETCNEQEKNG